MSNTPTADRTAEATHKIRVSHGHWHAENEPVSIDEFVAAYVPGSTFVAENSYYDEHGELVEQPAQIVLAWEHWDGECPDCGETAPMAESRLRTPDGDLITDYGDATPHQFTLVTAQAFCADCVVEVTREEA